MDNADEHDVSSLNDIDASSYAVSVDASIGTEVGITAFAEDQDAADSVTYSLTNDAGGLFAINSNSGVVSVNASLDYETSQQHTITVQALSTDQSSQSSDFKVQIINVPADDGPLRATLLTTAMMKRVIKILSN